MSVSLLHIHTQLQTCMYTYMFIHKPIHGIGLHTLHRIRTIRHALHDIGLHPIALHSNTLDEYITFHFTTLHCITYLKLHTYLPTYIRFYTYVYATHKYRYVHAHLKLWDKKATLWTYIATRCYAPYGAAQRMPMPRAVSHAMKHFDDWLGF